MNHPALARLGVVVLIALTASGCGGGGSAASTAAVGGGSQPVDPASARVVTTWHDAERLRPASSGSVLFDASGAEVRVAGQPVRVGDWIWYHDRDGSPIERIERFDGGGRSVAWTSFNADAVDGISRRGTIRDDADDAMP